MKKILFSFIICCSFNALFGQMEFEGETLFGNEWINYTKSYAKISVEEDGVYRIYRPQLEEIGFPIAPAKGRELVLYHYGKEVPIYVSTSGNFDDSDFIEFVGNKNDGRLDKTLYEDWESMLLNPYYSFYTEENNYYLAWFDDSDNHERVQSINNDLSGNLPSKEEYFIGEELVIFNDKHQSPSFYENVRYSHYFFGEGYGTELASQHTVNFNPENAYGAGFAPYLETRVGTYLGGHNLQFLVNGNLMIQPNINNFAANTYNISLTNAAVLNDIELKINGVLSADDKFSIAYSKLVYPKKFDLSPTDNYVFSLNASTNPRYFEVNNLTSNQDLFYFDATNGVRLTIEKDGNTSKFLIPASALPTKAYTYSQFLSPTEIQLYQASEQFEANNVNYIILTHSALNTSVNGTNYVQEYAEYRSSEEGGGFNVQVFNVEELYDEFGYGVEGHAQSINNFANYAKQTWPQLEYALILGKGLEYNLVREGINEDFYVPVYGIPGSDNLLFAAKNHMYPVASVGRLAIKDSEQIGFYLDKVKQHENPSLFDQTIEGLAWKKDIIHLSGGKSTDQDIIFNGLEQMREIVENNEYGARVTTFQKTASNDIENTVSQQIIDKINAGVSILTFFGHSAVGTLDFSIENPDKYDNYGKYPFMLAMGCLAGNIHTPSLGVSEDFVLAKDGGSIAFLAASGVATVTDQKLFGSRLYDHLGNEYYGRSIGLIIRAYIAEKEDLSFNSTNLRTLLEQLTLHGDPAISLLDHEGPDYIVDFSTIRTYPEDVNSTIDSFEVEFDIVNIGRGQNEGLFYQVIHDYGEGKDTIVGTTITPENRKTIREKIANKGLKGLGKNLIDIEVDQNNNIEEFPNPIAEMNNRLSDAYNNEGFCFFIYDNTPTPIYPAEFAIVNDSDFNYLSSAGNAFLAEQQYVLQVDTTNLFNSPLMASAEVKAYGGFIEVDIDYNYQNNTVYYWRIKNNESEEEVWSNSSFIYLPNESTGWNQSHIYQWLRDDYTNLVFDESNRTLNLGPTIGEFRIINTSRLSAEIKPQFFYNNQFFGANDERSNGGGKDINAGVYVIVIDPISTRPMQNLILSDMPWPGTDIGLHTTDRSYFSFNTFNETNRAELVYFLENDIPDGHHVVFWTIQSDEHSYRPDQWPLDVNPIHEVLINEGAEMTDVIINNGPLPYVFAYTKGNDPNVFAEALANDPLEELSVLVNIEGISDRGSVCSTPIGPAQSWESVEWSFSDFNQSEDEFSYDVLGLQDNGDIDTLYSSLNDNVFDLDQVDADVYPYIKLNLNSLDSNSFTSPQIDFWRVLYKGLPEAVVNPNIDYAFVADTIFKGNDLQLSLRVENITDFDMDSLLVMYTVVDQQNNEFVEFKRHAPLVGDDFIQLEYDYSTLHLNSGLHEFRVEVNPNDDQREQHHFNNLAFLNFLVKADDLNPLLDVTFDGVKIMNRDIVSPEPVISVNLTDDNPFELLTNKEDFDVSLEYPDGTILDVDVSGNDVIFYPADGTGKNRARLEYRPILEDGIYTLRAQAKDQAGNFSGTHQYEVDFEVITESSISNMLNYPNPFSSSTQFIFTLTGKEVPDDFVLRIMTLSGKVVKQITMEEFGPIHAGVNRSNYRWDGTDDYGSPLANGVYIYKVFLADNSLYEARYIEGIDSFFKKGFGKMVLMR